MFFSVRMLWRVRMMLFVLLATTVFYVTNAEQEEHLEEVEHREDVVLREGVEHEEDVIVGEELENLVMEHRQEPEPYLSSRIFTDLSNLTTPSFNSTYLLVVPLVVGGLLILSVLLYMLDVAVTARLDEYLYDSYGPALYERYTSTYDPYGLAAAYQSEQGASSSQGGGSFSSGGGSGGGTYVTSLRRNGNQFEPLFTSSQRFVNQEAHLYGYKRSFGHEPTWQMILRTLSKLNEDWE